VLGLVITDDVRHAGLDCSNRQYSDPNRIASAAALPANEAGTFIIPAGKIAYACCETAICPTTGVFMADLTLYHAAPSRSSIALWMLEEVGEPYDVKLLKLSEGDQL